MPSQVRGFWRQRYGFGPRVTGSERLGSCPRVVPEALRQLELFSSRANLLDVPSETPSRILAECHAAGKTGVFLLGEHAADRARDRNLGIDDIRHALTAATAATFQPNNSRWKVSGGADLEGVPVTFIVRLEGGLLVITLY